MRIALISRRTLFSQPGGDTVQVQQTAQYLQKQGLQVEVIKAGTPIKAGEYQVLHFFNLGRPADFLPYASLGIPYLISAIYIDYSAARPFMSKPQQVLAQLLGTHGMEYAKTIARGIAQRDNFPSLRYWLYGQKAAIQFLLKNAAFLVTASRAEATIIARNFMARPQSKIIPLGVEHCGEHLPKGAPTARKGVLCVARFEPLKNQLQLLKATQPLNIKLTLIGSASMAHRSYYEACKQMSTARVQFAGAIPPEQLPHYYAQCAVHVLPSFYETTGLSSLEALLQGCPIVVSDTPIQREIFADKAHYCQPGSAASIQEAIQEALKEAPDGEASRRWVQLKFSWHKAAVELAALYRQMA